MTEIVFEYNPIQVRAEIIIEGSEIAKTSNLYRYRNTPLEDWVDVLIPELVEYSNDDNIQIEIRSLQKYIDEINKAIRTYEKKHRHIDIEVIENPSTGYKGRLNKLSQIIEQIKEAEGELAITDEYPLDVLVVSMADEDEYNGLLSNIFHDIKAKSDQAILVSNKECEVEGFEVISHEISDFEDRHVDARVFIFPSLNECSNKYWRLLKEKVNGKNDYVMIALLNSKPKKNDELLDYIAEQLEKKGKINKSRFIFISENTEDNMDYIQDEYGVKLTDMLDYDSADESIDKVKHYIQNVSYVRKIAELSDGLKKQFEGLHKHITLEAEKNKSVAELDRFMTDYKNVMESINNHYRSLSLVKYGDFSAKNAKDEFIEMLTQNITEMLVEDVIKSMADLKDGKSEAMGKLFGLSSVSAMSITLGYNLLDLFKNGQKAQDVMALAESTLRGFIIYYISNHMSLEARKETEISSDIVLQKSYEVYPLIKDRVEELCKKGIDKIAAIEKKNDSGQKMVFFEWVTANISRTDMGLYSYSHTYLNYDKNDYSEVSKKIKRRLKTIEADFEAIFKQVIKALDFNQCGSVLEEKIEKIESMTDGSIKKIEKICNEELTKMDINDDDKCRIADLDDIMSELEGIINL